MSRITRSRRRASGAANEAAPQNSETSSDEGADGPAHPTASTTISRCPVPYCGHQTNITNIATLKEFTAHVREHDHDWAKDDPRLQSLLEQDTAALGDKNEIPEQCPICRQPRIWRQKQERLKHIWQCASPLSKWKMDKGTQEALDPAFLRTLADTQAPQSIPTSQRQRVGRLLTHLMWKVTARTGSDVHVRKGWGHLTVAFHALCLRKTGLQQGSYKDSTMTQRLQWFEEANLEKLKRDYDQAKRMQEYASKKNKGKSTRSIAKRNAMKAIGLCKEGATGKASNTVASNMRIPRLDSDPDIKAEYERHMDRVDANPIPKPPTRSQPVKLNALETLKTLMKIDGRKAAGAYAISPSSLRCMVQSDVHTSVFLDAIGMTKAAAEASEKNANGSKPIDPSAWTGATILSEFLNALVDRTFDPGSFLINEVFLASRGIPLYDDTKAKLRRIGIPCPWKSVCSKTVAREHREKLNEALGKLQTCMQSNAIDKAIHLIRARTNEDNSHEDDESEYEIISAAADLSGAFDNTRRHIMMQHVIEKVGFLAKYVYLMYSRPTVIYTQGHVYHQQVGVIQGEVLSMFLFGLLTAKPLAEAKKAMAQATGAEGYRFKDYPIVIGYADDSTFYGPRSQVVAGITKYAEHMHALGFTIETKVSKNIAWPISASTRKKYIDDSETSIPITYTSRGQHMSFNLHLRNTESGMNMLGAPIGDDQYVTAAMDILRKQRLERLEALLEFAHVRRRGPRVKNVHEPGVQCALYIARTCDVHRMTFYLRNVPAAQWNGVLQESVDDMRQFIIKVTCSDLHLHEMSSYAKTMMAQPLASNGFGLTDPTGIADIAFGLSLSQSVDCLGQHEPTKHIHVHWTTLAPIQVAGEGAALTMPALPLDHTETHCTTDYVDALTRLWNKVPMYMLHKYKEMATLADDNMFPTTLLTSLEKTQNSMSKGRHQCMLSSLKRHLEVTVPRENASTTEQRRRRHAALQIKHIQEATEAYNGALGSMTGAILRMMPRHPGLEIDNPTMRLFSIHMLRLWPDENHYRICCPLCKADSEDDPDSPDINIFNFHTHALDCPKVSGKRTARHDAVLTHLVQMSKEVVCDVPRMEPAGRDPNTRKRPDIEFRMSKDTSVTACGYEVIKADGYNCADTMITNISQKLITRAEASPPIDRIWKDNRDLKHNKHTNGTQVCLPIISTNIGALDPKFTKWLCNVVESSPFREEKGKYDIRRFYAKFLHIMWKNNWYMFEAYSARLSTCDTNIMSLPRL